MRPLQALLSAVAAAIGAATLGGWLAGSAVVASLCDGCVTMKPVTSILIAMVGIASLTCLATGVARVASSMTSVASLVLVSTCLWSNLLDLSAPFVSVERAALGAAWSPTSAPSPFTLYAIGSAALAAFVVATRRGGRDRAVAEFLSWQNFGVGFAALCGYEFTVPSLYAPAGSPTAIAMGTSISLMLLGAALIDATWRRH